MIVHDDFIIDLSTNEKPLIHPFNNKQVSKGMISYGLSSYGYDVTAADEFKIFTNTNAVTIDPKSFDPKAFVDGQLQDDGNGVYVVIPPN